MKKKIIICVGIVLAFGLVFFMPIPQGAYDDGGTRAYAALTYKLVQWNRMISVYNADGRMERVDRYQETSVYWFPDNLRSIDELCEMEYSNDG